MSMKPGDVLLFKGEDGISKLIRWGTNSKYSHVAVCVSPEMNLAIEAITRGGVRARDIRRIKTPYDVYRVKAPYNIDGMISYLVSKLNNKYDYLGVIFLGLLRLLTKIGLPFKKVANTWQKNRDYFCSELCYEAFYRGGGLDIVPDIAEADITSPGDIAKSKLVEYIVPGAINNNVYDKTTTSLKDRIFNILADNVLFKLVMLTLYIGSNIYFHTLSAFVVTSFMFITSFIVFYLWIHTFKKFLLIVLFFVCLIGLNRVLYNERNYLYSLSKIISKYSVNIKNAEYIGPEKIGPSYMLPFFKEINYKVKENLFFNKKPYIIVKAIMILNEDKIYDVRPLYVLFVKNIGQQSIKINKIEWQIYSNVRKANITGPNEWLKLVKQKPIEYPMLFPEGYFYYKYGPDPVSGYKDEITLTLNVYYKNLANDKNTTKSFSGIVAYNGTSEKYYIFNLKEENNNK